MFHAGLGECSNPLISLSAFLQNTHSRGNYTMSSVQQEHQRGVHSMIGDGLYWSVLLSYTILCVIRNSLMSRVRPCLILLPNTGNYSNSGFDPSSFLKTGNTSEFSSSCTTRIVFILTTGVSFLRSYKVSNKRPIMGCPGSDLDCPKTVSGWTGYVSVQSEYG